MESDPQCPAKSSGGVEGGGTVMKHEDMAVATVAKEGATQFPNIRRCLYPALCFRIKFSKLLQRVVLILIQKFDPNSGCEINGVTSRVNPFLFSFFLPFSVITDTSTPFRAFRRTIIKYVFVRLWIIANNIWFTASDLHGMK